MVVVIGAAFDEAEEYDVQVLSRSRLRVSRRSGRADAAPCVAAPCDSDVAVNIASGQTLQCMQTRSGAVIVDVGFADYRIDCENESGGRCEEFVLGVASAHHAVVCAARSLASRNEYLCKLLSVRPIDKM